jgi:hypothetical protein
MFSFVGGRGKPPEKSVISLEYGKGRTKLSFVAKRVGDDWVACMIGGKAHVGAVGVGVYDEISGRASSSVITLAGHRDDRIAKEGAERISKHTKSATVLIVGIHVENITEKEISMIIKNSEHLVGMFLEKLKAQKKM